MSRFVPCVMVIGRSVLSRKVRQGTPSTVVSSWTPPESVSTSRAWLKPQEVEVAGGRRCIAQPVRWRRPAARPARGSRGMHWKHDGARRRSRRVPSASATESCRVVHVRRPVQGDAACSALARGRGPCWVPDRAACARWREQRVDHGVADEVHLVGGMPSWRRFSSASGCVVKRSWRHCRRRRLISSGIQRSKRPEPGLDVRDRHARLGGHDRAGESRVDVTDHRDDVGGSINQLALELDHDARSLLGVRSAAGGERYVGSRHLQIGEERRHVIDAS